MSNCAIVGVNWGDEGKGRMIDLLAEKSEVFPSKGEARRTIAGGGVSINKVKLESADNQINSTQLIGGKYLLVQKGKKNYFLLIAE